MVEHKVRIEEVAVHNVAPLLSPSPLALQFAFSFDDKIQAETGEHYFLRIYHGTTGRDIES